MRKYKDLDLLVKHHDGVKNKTEFCDLLLADMKQSCCFIFGETIDDQPVLLAELKIQPDSLALKSGIFHQQIEFVVEGNIVNDQYPPINYRVNADTFQFYGRCSAIPQICGVDLYLDKSYTKKLGDHVKQKLTLPVHKLFRSLK